METIKVHPNKMTSRTTLSNYVPTVIKEDNLYDDYKKYDYIGRAEFSKFQLPDELKKNIDITIANVKVGLTLESYLLSITHINENLVEVAFKLEDTDRFNAWKFGNQNSESLKRSITEKFSQILPIGVKIGYVRFKKGSFILIIGFIVIAAVSGNFLSALSGLFGLYRVLMEKKEIKDFLENLDLKFLSWMSKTLEVMKDWVNTEMFAKLVVAMPILVGATILLGPIGGVLVAGVVALIMRYWDFDGGASRTTYIE